jgi:hypothetical protein
MRRRDIIKYSLAGVMALGTFGAIMALEVAKTQRRFPDADGQRRTLQTLDTFGQVDRSPLDPPPPVGNRPTPLPPSGTP